MSERVPPDTDPWASANAVMETDSCESRGQSVDKMRRVYPTDNEWGVPLLRLDRQVTAIDLPFACWSRERRKSRMRGLWHYYCDDTYFSAIWRRPADVVNSGCIGAVECNFSVHAQHPRTVALWATYKKRWLARTWQEWGIRTIVDLNVAAEHADLNLLGIPKGWKAFCTRGSVHRLEDIARELDVARSIAGSDPLFIVYGGGKAVQEVCRREGALWFAEAQDEERKR